MYNCTKYEHIAKFRNVKGERIKLVIKPEKAVIVFKSPLGAVYEKSVIRSEILKRKSDDELSLYRHAIEDMICKLLESLKFEFDRVDLINEVYYCGVQ